MKTNWTGVSGAGLLVVAEMPRGRRWGPVVLGLLRGTALCAGESHLGAVTEAVWREFQSRSVGDTAGGHFLMRCRSHSRQTAYRWSGRRRQRLEPSGFWGDSDIFIERNIKRSAAFMVEHCERNMALSRAHTSTSPHAGPWIMERWLKKYLSKNVNMVFSSKSAFYGCCAVTNIAINLQQP